MKGKLYAVGVGPGDPELLTLKAARVLSNADVIACPAKDGGPGLAYRIAEQACPGISGKETLLLDFPMRKGDLTELHRKAAESLISVLSTGKTTACLTLGDPCVYSTFSYISDYIKEAGFETEIVSGIPSFCAVAARLGLPIAQGDEAVMITPREYVDFDGTIIIMKAGSDSRSVREEAGACGKSAYLVKNYGMPEEAVYTCTDPFPERSGYFSTIIVKQTCL